MTKRYIIGERELMAAMESHIGHTKNVRLLCEIVNVDEAYFKNTLHAMYEVRQELFERMKEDDPPGTATYEQMVYGAAFVDAFFLALKAVFAVNGQNPAAVIGTIKRILGVNRVAKELGIEIPGSIEDDMALLYRALYGEDVQAEVNARMAEADDETDGVAAGETEDQEPREFDPDRPHIHCDFCGAGINLPEGTTMEEFEATTKQVVEDGMERQRKANPGSRVHHMRTQVACLECAKLTPEELLEQQAQRQAQRQ